MAAAAAAEALVEGEYEESCSWASWSELDSRFQSTLGVEAAAVRSLNHTLTFT